MKVDDYIQSSSRIRVLEKSLLTKSDFNRMIEAESLDEAISVLRESKYSQFFNNINDPLEYDDSLQEAEKDLYKNLKELGGNELYKFFTIKFDIHNLKIFLKDRLMGTDNKDLLIENTEFDKDFLENLFSGSRDKTNLYSKIESEIQSIKDTRGIEILVDKYYLKELEEMAKSFKYPYFEKLVKDEIDFQNIYMLIRSKFQSNELDFVKKIVADGGNISKEKLFAHYYEALDGFILSFKYEEIYKLLKEGLDMYNKSGRISDFEKAKDYYDILNLKENRFVVTGPEVIYTYFKLRERELKNIRIILLSKQNGLSNDFIKERLGETYV